MAHPPGVDRETLIEILEDVRHDLGKHLPLPLRLLPADADDGAVRAAARKALRETRRGPDGVTDGARLWADFEAELSDALDGPLRAAGPRWAALVEAVERALAWAGRLDGPLDRAALLADLTAVTPAVDRLLDDLDDPAAPLPEDLL